MSKLKLFILSVTCTMVGTLCYLYVERRLQPELKNINDQVFLTAQLQKNHMQHLRWQGFHEIVDLRPDGEASDQPSSAEMQEAAKRSGLGFHYIPVPHESLPDEAADSLRSILAEFPARIVLYCRTGRRAVRLYALAIASDPHGPDADRILGLVRSAGFSADDLRDRIEQRISKRSAF